MKRIIGMFISLALALGLAAGAAAEVAQGDRAAIHGLIQNQLSAFQADDGATAWGYASPTIQSFYPTPDQFMAMVRGAYQPVYRPQSVIFGETVDTPAGPLQKVYLTGPDGLGYLAVYAMQRQPDGSWKINGCTIVRDDTPAI